ncbi:inovirus Gp2 family protein [Citrobacter portucalensis]|uniref:YagK/YfjJ domain-containing protein n=1 Tax=Citrobacter portucalensis TaxID=1639133 RepID=UPI000E485C4C|nr:inovirus-type Gp2 protein [Citrobacter portucalensis]RHH45608.1 inovirus Gp2 family protein [Citrobacter portucalensis]
MKKNYNNQEKTFANEKAFDSVFNKIGWTTSTAIHPKGNYFYKDILWPVLPAEHDQDLVVMKKIFDTVDKVSTASRFLAVRYDLHVPAYSANNAVVEYFLKLLFDNLALIYPKSFVSYVWVREQTAVEPQHYHLLLLMDGNCIRHPNKLNGIVDTCWKNAGGARVWFPKNCYYFVTANNFKAYADLMLRVSYMGKRRTKESIEKGIARVGKGSRKPKKINSKKRASPIHSACPVAATHPQEPQELVNITTERYSGMLDKYFLGEAALPTFLRRKSHYELYDQNKWWTNYAPRWGNQRHNYLFEALITGISLSDYASKYRLSRQRVYANCRSVGGQSLKIIHWAWHRYRFLQSNSTLDSYLKNNKLRHKTARRQLQRKPMSDFWSWHFDNYYMQFWPYNWTVAGYCQQYNLVPSTARRYLVDFPFIGLINPFLLKQWL